VGGGVGSSVFSQSVTNSLYRYAQMLNEKATCSAASRHFRSSRFILFPLDRGRSLMLLVAADGASSREYVRTLDRKIHAV
jgi:hypothetical protein